MLVSVALLATLLVAGGCSKDGEAQPEDKQGYGMGGVDQEIKLLAEAVNNRPEPWDLATPESAVRSYLDWISYAYRTAESEAATPTQSAYQVVRTDAYIQANLQKERVMDQTLDSITFGKASVEETTASLPAEEHWTYRYVSISEPGKTVEGPNKASYKTTYKLVKSDAGWVVDDIEVAKLESGK